MNKLQKVTILGAGAWGTAIAATVARAQGEAILWGRDKESLNHMTKTNQHPNKLPDVILPETINYIPELESAIDGADIIFLVIPTQKISKFLKEMPALNPHTILVNCAKGLEQEELLLPHQIIKNHCDNICLSLSGPNFAIEIAQNKPAATIIAGNQNHQTAIESVMQSLNHQWFRPYYHFDQIGLESVGLIKNVIAIACGMAMAMDLGENARMALITRSIHEIMRLVDALGGKKETTHGLGGIGDLMLTCSSLKSRNTSFGYDFIKGAVNIQEFLNHGEKTVEGVFSAKAIYQLFPKLELPICHAIYQVLYQNADPYQLSHQFFERPLKAE